MGFRAPSASADTFGAHPDVVYNQRDYGGTENKGLSGIHPNPSATEEDPVTVPSGRASRGLHFLREILETLLFALIAFAIVHLVVQNYRIEGPSMKPNLHEGQFLVVNKLAYRLGEVQRGDIVVFHYPNPPQRDLIKRVVGLPGDRLEIVRGQVRINGQPLDEPYVLEQGGYSHPATVIEPDHVFVMGDNRNNSNDSRRWGSLPIGGIVGKPVLCYWPPEYWGLIYHERPT
jgi:signal peptidase I